MLTKNITGETCIVSAYADKKEILSGVAVQFQFFYEFPYDARRSPGINRKNESYLFLFPESISILFFIDGIGYEDKFFIL